MRNLSLFIVSFLLCSLAFAEQNIPIEDKNYFRAPLDIPMFLSGNFGELRNNHFHSGIDIKTQGKEGLKVYAAADGIVSRIKVSPYGFGLTVYIDHPNGYTTVYAHLNRFNPQLNKLVKDIQYSKESSSIDELNSAGFMKVKKGDIIAYSGNSGSSGGPHLHFEIRDTETEHPINPLLFNFSIKDDLPPVIKGLMVYPLTEDAIVAGGYSQKQYNVVGYKDGKYLLANNAKVTANGLVGLGLYVQDFLNGSGNRCGIFENNLHVDNELIYSFCMDEFDFDDTRYANSYMDYAYYKKKRIRYQKSFVDECNGMTNFKVLRNRGRLLVNESDTMDVRFMVNDVANNRSSLSFKIYGEKASRKMKLEENDNYIDCSSNSQLIKDNSNLHFEPGTFYTNIPLEHKELDATNLFSSKIILVGTEYIPVHKYFKLSIKAEQLPDSLTNKFVIVSLDSDNKITSSLGGKYDNEYVTTNARQLGRFAVALDTIPPSIKALSIDNNTSLNNPRQLNFKILDELAGIANFRGEIDGKWVLFTYNDQSKKISYIFDSERLEMNKKHHVKLQVTDKVGNTSYYEGHFFK